MLVMADEALMEERWEDAVRLATQAQSVPGQPPYVSTAAENIKQRVERGKSCRVKCSRSYKRSPAKTTTGALSRNRELPPRTSFRITAQQHYDLLQQLVVAYHLQQAEAERSLGRCDKIEPHVAKILG